MKFFTALLATVSMGLAQQAWAQSDVDMSYSNTNLEVPTWTCDLNGNISGLGISVFFGGQIIGGKGMITCKTTDGKSVQRLPVYLRFISAGVGFDFTIINKMQIIALGIGVTDGPQALVGEFAVGATAGATFITKGVDVTAAVKVERKDGLGFEVGMIGKEAVGLGVHLHGMVFTIEALKGL